MVRYTSDTPMPRHVDLPNADCSIADADTDMPMPIRRCRDISIHRCRDMRIDTPIYRGWCPPILLSYSNTPIPITTHPTTDQSIQIRRYRIRRYDDTNTPIPIRRSRDTHNENTLTIPDPHLPRLDHGDDLRPPLLSI